MEFATQYNWIPDSPEVGSGEIIVETSGYMTTQQRVEALLLAGQRLDDYRKMSYDSDLDDFDDDEFYDPTRSPGYDLADATQQLLSIQPVVQANSSLEENHQQDLKDSDNSVKSEGEE